MAIRFKHSMKRDQNLSQIHTVPLVNITLLTVFFFMLVSPLVAPSSVDIRMPKAITSSAIQEDSLVITVTSEDVLYLNNQIVTVKELRNALKKNINKKKSILVKADRRSSIDRMISIWDICRNLGIENINIATNHER